jgi:hypothetical protein
MWCMASWLEDDDECVKSHYGIKFVVLGESCDFLKLVLCVMSVSKGGHGCIRIAETAVTHDMYGLEFIQGFFRTDSSLFVQEKTCTDRIRTHPGSVLGY